MISEDIDIFLGKLEKQENGCNLWNGSKYSNGYGRHWDRHKQKMVLAHRYIYEHYFGPIPKGMVIAHHCDVVNCCEITHLFLTDHKGNSLDMMKKGRHNLNIEALRKATELWKGSHHTEEQKNKWREMRKGIVPVAALLAIQKPGYINPRTGRPISLKVKEKLKEGLIEYYKNNRNVEKICRCCNKEFIGLKNQQFCCKECQKIESNKRHQPIVEKTLKLCKNCNKEFLDRSTKLYCSEECRIKQKAVRKKIIHKKYQEYNKDKLALEHKIKMDAVKIRMTEVHKGHKYNLGHKHSEETKLKMKASSKAYHARKKLEKLIPS